MEVAYNLEAHPALGPEEFIDLLNRSTLAERRPVAEVETVKGMLEHADVIVTARAGALLVGVSRAITDFHYCTYLSELAVDENWHAARESAASSSVQRMRLPGSTRH